MDNVFDDGVSAQEIFDYVARHLARQGRKSMYEKECRYRGPGNTMCAVGCLIKDNEYYPAMEGRTMNGIILPPRFLEHTNLLRQLQLVHDSVDVEEWPQVLRGVAAQFHLNTSAADDIFRIWEV